MFIVYDIFSDFRVDAPSMEEAKKIIRAQVRSGEECNKLSDYRIYDISKRRTIHLVAKPKPTRYVYIVEQNSGIMVFGDFSAMRSYIQGVVPGSNPSQTYVDEGGDSYSTYGVTMYRKEVLV